MKRILLLLILTFVCFVAVSSAQNRTELERSLLMRPNDLLGHFPGWSTASTDGFTYWMNSGNYGYYGPQPTFYLDGIPVDISYFGWQNINMLPLMVEQLDSVSYSETPGMYQKRFAEAGYVDISSIPPDSGLHASSSLFLGNEAGDPGPWIYDSSKITPNVDRWGPDYSGQISYGTDKWYVRGRFSLRKHQPTDLMNHRRIDHALNSARNIGEEPYKRIITTVGSGLIEAGYRSQDWNATGRVIRSQNKDFPFVQPLGRELPAILDYQQVALQTSYSSSLWTYSLQYLNEDKGMDHRSYSDEYTLDWEEAHQTLSFSARRSFDTVDWKGGLSYQHSKASESSTSFNPNEVITAFSRVTYPLRSDYVLQLDGSLDLQDSELAPTATLAFSGRPSPDWQMKSEITFSESLPYRQNKFAYQLQKGFSLLDQLDVSADLDTPIQNNTLLKFKTEHKWNINNALDLAIEGSLLKHYQLNIPWTELDYDADTHSHPQAFTYSSQSGTRGGLSMGIDHHPTTYINHRLTAFFRFTAAGTDRYRSYWQQVPSKTLEYFLSIQPVDDLQFSLCATWRSQTKWQEYRSLEGERYRSRYPHYQRQYGTFQTKTPSFLNIRISGRKWFWDRRLSTTFSVRNMLNREIRTHTLGADLSLLFFIKASLFL